ncbi:hypothetical protein NP493_293g04083 [Ridgeia piscesae]|uniref:Transmembrane protein 179 n=1 Tax=Ridgeia piscesae TaxID=27915 RepID=A0AAD9NWR7_RIDPI|nr:hypothetical protein NP493_293g04083 [Ridgeia piscesae]
MFDVQLFSQTILYFASCIAGAVSSVTIALTMGDFRGGCILYGNWKKRDATTVELDYGNRSNCNFILTTHGVFSLVLPFLVGCYFAYAVKRSSRDKDIAFNMWVMPFSFIAGLVTILVFIASAIASVGFSSWCDGYVKLSPSGCSDVLNTHWLNLPIKHKTTYKQLQVLQIASWTCLLVWILQTGLCIMRVVRNRRRLSREADQESDRANIGRINPSA